MKPRLLIGAAAVFGAFCFTGQARAADDCSHWRNEARKTSDLDTLNNLLTRASGGCDVAVVQAIRDRITAVRNGPQGSNSGQASPTPPPSGPPSPPTPPAHSSVLTIGQTANGALTDHSATDSNGVAYDAWSFHADAGQHFEVTMTAANNSGLDTYLSVGRASGGQYQEIASNDDRGDGTLNSMVRFQADRTGDYAIRARTFGAGQYGAYQLLVRPYTQHAVVTNALNIGQTVNGSLTEETATDSDNVPYDVWTFHADAGQRLQISMSAAQGSSLDTYLVVGRVNGGEFHEIASNDDRGDGTFNSLLRFVPPDTGEYTIHARTFSSDSYGAYQLSVTANPFVVSSPQSIDARANAWSQQGDLTDTVDHMDFEFHPDHGKRYSVRAISDDFTPVVDVALLGSGGHVTEVNFFDYNAANSNQTGASSADANTRPSEVAEFRADAQGRYIFRVSAANLKPGHFSLIVTEVH
jgi:hypothetical protein